ncbi:MAG: hypothetical protein KBC69_00255 [Candidatus Magasanikbacteria bacterium]|nr:hypothetical protein [Candidatus Magasanikbacteria bacterium]
MYLSWNEKTTTDFSDKTIEALYNDGYVFTRLGRGILNQTRSLRINLETFQLSSENKRILKKTENLICTDSPIPYEQYTWNIHKMGKEFYEQKFGEKTFGAQKIKELITNSEKSNFNKLFTYSLNAEIVGYCISLETKNIIHYCYPFYDLNIDYPNLGMGMMLQAIVRAKKENKKYIYLGSAQRPTDTYKLQFNGLEWFDGKAWQANTNELKQLLQNHS